MATNDESYMNGRERFSSWAEKVKASIVRLIVS